MHKENNLVKQCQEDVVLPIHLQFIRIDRIPQSLNRHHIGRHVEEQCLRITKQRRKLVEVEERSSHKARNMSMRLPALTCVKYADQLDLATRFQSR